MTYTKIPKPTSSSYTKIGVVFVGFDQADVAYDSTTILYDGPDQNAFTKVPKPTVSTYTKITKPT